ncbi:MAG: SMI1/KNR4 family protein [Clostridia bacterium]|nr:SMI1/KNR4 family protein [Clostridia bacterium]
MDYQKFDRYCKKLIKCYSKLDTDAIYQTAPCADEESIKEVEESLGVKLPGQLRDFFLNFSEEVEISAFFPDDFCHFLPKKFKGIFGVQCTISLEEVENNENSRRDWVSECFNNEENEYDRVWHKKLGIIEVGNGDIIALDTETNPDNPPVVYLSHDDGEGHGAVLGKDFDTFLMNLISVGGCGMEDWQILPFVPDMQKGIDPDCNNAKEFRKIIGFDLDKSYPEDFI